MTHPLLPHALRVLRRTQESHDTFTLEAEAPEGFAFSAGQFNMLHVPGVGECAISISGSPRRSGRLVHTIRVVGEVTRHLSALRSGDELYVRGPFGSPWPVERAHGQDLLLVAGGIGLAPLRPALYAALARPKRVRRVALAFGARSADDLLFTRELERFRAQGATVGVTVDRATEGWQGPVGVVTKLLPELVVDPPSTVAFLCGPEIMMRFAARELERLGVAAEDVWVTLERNMKCGVGTCGHCQLGPYLICRDGPVFRYPRVSRLMTIREL